MHAAATRRRPRRLVTPLEGDAAALDLAEALSRLRARRDPVLLDSAGGAPRDVSVLGFDPLARTSASTLRELRAELARLAPPDGDALPPGADAFAGGFLGALSYDLGVEGEALALPRDPWALPLVAGGLYCDHLVRDERAGRTWLVLWESPGDGRPPVAARRASLLADLARPAAVTTPRPLGALLRHVPPEAHQARVEAARRWIAQGEIYQANLAHPFTRPLAGDPVDLYLALRAASPTPYAGFLRQDDADGRPAFALLSASPELLLAVDPAAPPSAARARTRPIKGTARRSADPDEDRRRARALQASVKDRAELAMIVDLERNDLGRVARPGGVHVPAFPVLESHPSVHHLAADVVASLRAGVGPLDALAALFPGGSVTGAPKLRSMEAIAALEEEGRGFAFGSLGSVDVAGRARLNLLIRTLLWRPLPSRAGLAEQHGEVLLRVGGGITWASDPAAEDDETLAKAAALLGALEGPGRQEPGRSR